MTIWLSVMSLAWIYVGCYVLPRFDQIFRDFRADLPVLTKIVLMMSRWCREDFGWTAVLLVPAAPVAFDRLNRRRWAVDGVPRRTRLLFGLLVLVNVAAFILVIVALFSPMTSLAGGVSSPPPGPIVTAQSSSSTSQN